MVNLSHSGALNKSLRGRAQINKLWLLVQWKEKMDLSSSLLHPPVATFFGFLHSAHQVLKNKFAPGRWYVMGCFFFLVWGTNAHYFPCSKNISHFTLKNTGRCRKKRKGVMWSDCNSRVYLSKLCSLKWWYDMNGGHHAGQQACFLFGILRETQAGDSMSTFGCWVKLI